MRRRAVVLGLVGLVVAIALHGPDAEAGRVRLRVGTLAIDGSRYMLDIRALGKEIERRTRRGVRIDWIPGGQLGDDRAMADQIARGTLDGGGLSETGLIALVPEMAVWQYPGLFQRYDEVDRATAALDATVREAFDRRDLAFLMWADLGFAHLFSTAPISSVGALIGIAAPWLDKPLDARLTAAITDGRARAWAMPPLYMLAIGATHARYMTELRYRYVVGGLVLSHAAWAKLSTTQQAVIRDVCREWEPKLRASWRRETERGVATLSRAGIAVRATPAGELAAFAAAAARSRDPHARKAHLDPLVHRIVKASATR